MTDFKTNLLEAIEWLGSGITPREEQYLDRVIDESFDNLDDYGFKAIADLAHDIIRENICYVLRQCGIDGDIDCEDCIEILNDLYEQEDGLDDTAYEYYKSKAYELDMRGVEFSCYLLFNDIVRDAERCIEINHSQADDAEEADEADEADDIGN